MPSLWKIYARLIRLFWIRPEHWRKVCRLSRIRIGFQMTISVIWMSCTQRSRNPNILWHPLFSVGWKNPVQRSVRQKISRAWRDVAYAFRSKELPTGWGARDCLTYFRLVFRKRYGSKSGNGRKMGKVLFFMVRKPAYWQFWRSRTVSSRLLRKPLRNWKSRE